MQQSLWIKTQQEEETYRTIVIDHFKIKLCFNEV